MNKIIFLIFLLYLTSCSENKSEKNQLVDDDVDKEIAQNTYRELDSTLASENVNTDTTILSNGALLYYKIDHDSLWLTLENKKKIILFSTGFDLVGYHYRLDYQFYKEFNKYLLFRYGCPANGPCGFVLIDKNSGKEFMQLPELIYNHDGNVIDDYLIYFSNDREKIIFFNVNTNTKIEYKHGIEDFKTAITPEYEFDSIKRLQKKYELYYGEVINGQRKAKKLSVDLNKYH